jgi:SPP1 family predicted phage head-tail adaptor
MADIGKRNRLIKFYRPLSAVNAANEAEGWEDEPFKEKWAEVKGETGMGSIRAAAMAGGVHTPLDNYSFRVSYDRSIDLTMRLVDPEGDVYNIIAVRHDKARRQYTDIVAQLGGANG